VATKKPRNVKHEKILLWLNGIAQIHGRDLSPAVITAYIEDLEEFSIDRIRQGFKKARQEINWFPKPAEIREKIKSTQFAGSPQVEREDPGIWKAAKHQRRGRNMDWDRHMRDFPAEAYGDVVEFCNLYPWVAKVWMDHYFAVEIIKSQIMYWKQDEHDFRTNIQHFSPLPYMGTESEHKDLTEWVWRQVQRTFDGEIKPTPIAGTIDDKNLLTILPKEQ